MKFVHTLLMVLAISLSQTTIASTFKTEKWRTSNGVQVVFYPAMEVPMIDISMAFAAGSAYDGKEYGLSALTGHMLNQGNEGQDATAIAETLSETGAQFSNETNRDMTVFNLRTLSNPEALAQSVNVFAKIINHPDFPEEAFAREKKQLLMAIEQGKDSPEEIAELEFFKALYRNHPYAHPVSGTEKTVNALHKNQIIDFYHRYYVANNAILVIVGAININQAHRLAEQLTKELPQGQPAEKIPQAMELTQQEKIHIQFPSSQTVIRLGQIGIDHHNPDYFPLMVGNYILGGGALVSRLALEVREKRGLTYGIDSQFAPMPGKGPFLISLSTRNPQAKQALSLINEVLTSYIHQGPSARELEAAQHYLTGSFPLSLSGNRNIAVLLLRMTFYNLPDNYLDTYVDRINQVTAEGIKDAFARQINPDKLLLVTVGQS